MSALGSRGWVISIAVAVAATACRPPPVFRLSADENNAYALRQALARRALPASPSPVNASGQPRVFALAAGAPKTIIAYDLAAGSVLWKTDADVQSRIRVGGDFIVALEGTQLVARDQGRGAPRWKVSIGGTYVGAAADRDRAYLVIRDGNAWTLTAYDGASGARLWSETAAGELGAPEAHGGVVYVPFLNQWLTILDGKTGAQLTRLRGIDEQISTLRVTSTAAYYGSKQGMFRLDERSASGRRADATYGQVEIPSQLERTTYSRDAYDRVQRTYSAADRAQVLWDSLATTQGPMRLVGESYAIHYFRYVFGFGQGGTVRWAYSHPRVELVASTHTGAVILGVAQNGEVVALDPLTGAVRARKSLDIAGPVLGATFDADGWAPSSPTESIESVAALIEIVHDRDARFERVKELAVSTLATLPGAEVTSALLALLTDERASPVLKDAVVAALVARKDATSLAVLTETLAVKTDYIAGTTPDLLVPVAKTIAGLAGVTLAPAQAAATLAALRGHLEAAATVTTDVVHVIGAMAAIGGGAERGALAAHLLLYHVDDDRGADASWQKAIVDAIARDAGPAERVLLRYVASDPRTQPGLVELIAAVLGQD